MLRVLPANPYQWLGAVMAGAIFLFSGVLGYRLYVGGQTDEQLCAVMYRLVARSGATIGKPGSPGYDYYRTHPMELALAREQNKRFLRELPCTIDIKEIQ